MKEDILSEEATPKEFKEEGEKDLREEDSEDDQEDYEREDVRFILQNDIDYVIHSIYNNHQEITDFKTVIKQEAEALGELAINKDVRIMAKLENEDAINDLNKILENNVYFIPYAGVKQFLEDGKAELL